MLTDSRKVGELYIYICCRTCLAYFWYFTPPNYRPPPISRCVEVKSKLRQPAWSKIIGSKEIKRHAAILLTALIIYSHRCIYMYIYIPVEGVAGKRMGRWKELGIREQRLRRVSCCCFFFFFNARQSRARFIKRMTEQKTFPKISKPNNMHILNSLWNVFLRMCIYVLYMYVHSYIH